MTEKPLRSGRSLPFSLLLWRGIRRKCPQCGLSPAFDGYLKQTRCCRQCGEELGRIRAEDGPAWLTILLVGHLMAIPMAEAYLRYDMDAVTGAILWPAVAFLLSLGLLPVVKGLWVALMWRLKARDGHTPQ